MNHANDNVFSSPEHANKPVHSCVGPIIRCSYTTLPPRGQHDVQSVNAVQSIIHSLQWQNKP